MDSSITIHEQVKEAAIQSSSETRVAHSDADLGYGEWVRQGDVYIRRHHIDVNLEPFGKLTPTARRQVVPDDDDSGASSVGSRHIVREGTAQLYNRVGADALTGPIIVAPDGFYLEHPQHADFDIRLPGVYEVRYQQDLTKAEIARLRD